MKYRLEFTRDVTTRDAYSIDVEAADAAEATRLAERMAAEMDHCCPDDVTETGPADCDSWMVARVRPVTMAIADDPAVPVRANDAAGDEARDALAMPAAVWDGLLRAAEAGIASLGTDRDAIAGIAVLRAHLVKTHRAA